MSIVHFDGFDLNASVETGLDGGGDQDTGYFWQNSTVYRMTYVAGHGTGNALRVVEQIISRDNNFVPPAPVVRIGWWGRLDVAHAIGDPGVSAAGSCVVSWGLGNTDSPTKLYSLRVSNLGTVSLEYNNVTMTGSDFVLNGFSTSTFNYYEFYVNSTIGRAELYRNGVLILHGTGGASVATDPVNLHVLFGSNQTGLAVSRFYPVIDHLWISDGSVSSDSIDIFHDEDYLGVAVMSVQDKHGADGFMDGHIDFGDDWHQNGIHTTTNIDSVSYDAGKNIGNQLSWFWFEDPRDDAAWTPSKIDAITSFGLCYFHNTDTDDYRVANLALAFLVYNDGKPLVKHNIAGAQATFSAGTWTKSNPTLSYQAHIRHVPRANTEMINNVTSLYTHATGCIAFSVGPPAEEIPDSPPFDQLGITFAEEWRTDHYDWARVFGGASGLNYDSFFISGYSIFGQDDKKFQSNYVTVNYENVPQGQCYIQGLWDFAYDPNTGRWSMKQQVYSEPYANEAFKHAPRKLKVRGNGRALQLYVSSKDNAPFKINGWTILLTINQAP